MLPVGRILRRQALGTVAMYRVVQDGGETVTVEVVEAPGLPAGFLMRLDAADAQAMETIHEPAAAREPGAAPRRTHSPAPTNRPA